LKAISHRDDLLSLYLVHYDLDYFSNDDFHVPQLHERMEDRRVTIRAVGQWPATTAFRNPLVRALRNIVISIHSLILFHLLPAP